MSADRSLGRRKLLVIGAAASVAPACSGVATPLGGPYGGTTMGEPPPSSENNGGPSSGGGSGSGSSGGSGSSSSSSSGSSSSSSSGGSSSSSGSGSSSSSSGSGSSSSSGSSSGTGSSSSGSTSNCTTGGNSYTLPFSQYPMLQQVGGSATVTVQGYSDPNCPGSDIIVVQDSPGVYTALSAMCPHQWCDVQYDGPGQGFTCPCHQAHFDITGTSAGIRTNKPLAVLKTCADSNGVTVSWS